MAGLGAFILVAAGVWSMVVDRLQIEGRVRSLSTTQLADHAPTVQMPRATDVMRSAIGRLRASVLRLAPEVMIRQVNELLERAGVTGRMDGATLLFRQALALLVTIGLWIVVSITVSNLPSLASAFAVLLVIAVLVIPYANLTERANRRKNEIQAAFPDFLDLLVVCVEAGMGVDAALQRVTRESRGAIHEEFGRAISEIQVTRSRGDALMNIARRTHVEDVVRFALAVRQAEQIGSGIASVLRSQAALERDFAMRRAEERAARIPVKMVIPVVVFVLPGLFIIILGPALLSMVKIFK